jgi:hypothetical protein
VHFIGGEPTLEVEIIKLFQALVTRKVQYSITTNGSFADADSFFDQIRIDDLTLSYDKFHAPFISIEVLKNVIRTAIKRGIKVSIRSTYKRIDDLNIVKPLLGDKNVTVLPAALIHGGRYFESSGVDYSCNPFNEPCPSSINSSLKRHRVTYYPSKGFSPCCGPLLFSSNVKEILYGDTLETSAFHGLVNEKFDNLFRKYGLRPCNEHQYSTVCDACVSLFGAIDHRNSPSLRAIVRDVRTYILPLSGPVDDASLFALAHRYDAKILYFADAMIRDRLSLEPMLASSIVSSVDLDSSSCDEIAELYNRVFFDPFSEYLRGSTLNTKDGFRSAVKDYHSVLYRKNNKLVGALLLQYRERYSYAPEKAGWHVGFVGYDKAWNAPQNWRVFA